MLKESGIQMPTRRTLNDYTHWLSATPGFHNAIDNMLVAEANIEKLEDWQKYVTHYGQNNYNTMIIDTSFSYLMK